MQLVSEAKRICPQLIVILGEDLSKFRDVSKALATYLGRFTWSGKCERLGFDEVWLDCTDTVDYSLSLLNHNDLQNSYFHLDKDDPMVGFNFDASVLPGQVFPLDGADPTICEDDTNYLSLRLRLGAHLARFLRQKLEERGFTATVGISVNKLLSKIVGSLHKPNAQTTLLPPYNATAHKASTVNLILDALEINKIPGIGFKLCQKLQSFISARHTGYEKDTNLIDSQPRTITVGDLRKRSEASPMAFQKILGGSGWPKDIGSRVYCLLNGVDDSEVGAFRKTPTQISIEDSYIRLDTLEGVRGELLKLSISLLKRLRIDLTEDVAPDSLESPHTLDNEAFPSNVSGSSRHSGMVEWIAVPRTLRLSTRPRPPLKPDGSRTRASNRISRSTPLPSFMLLLDDCNKLATRLVDEVLLPLMFEKLHPAGSQWNLSLLNIAVTNISVVGGDDKAAQGRNILRMLQSRYLETKDAGAFHVNDKILARSDHVFELEMSELSAGHVSGPHVTKGSEDFMTATQETHLSNSENLWRDDDRCIDFEDLRSCEYCEATVPAFAMEAHLRFHIQPD